MKFVKIEGMTCAHCVARVEKALRGLAGAEGVRVNLRQGTAEMTGVGVSDEALRGAVADAGYEVASISDESGSLSLFQSDTVSHHGAAPSCH